jgi:hypothetical protein
MGRAFEFRKERKFKRWAGMAWYLVMHVDNFIDQSRLRGQPVVSRI